jgi:membrane-bound lytic murein transglycosylase D
MFEVGQALFEAIAPTEIKAEFAFPTREQWDEFAARLEKTRQNGSLAELAAYEPEARLALAALRATPGYEDYADWLAERIDEIAVAKAAGAAETKRSTDVVVEITPAPPAPPKIPPTPAPPSQPAPAPMRVIPGAGVPLYGLWVQRLQGRPRPVAAEALLPVLRPEFTAQGVAEALVWLAEAESTFNPRARSPAGARGLFQFMPVTAKAMGLSLLPLDERTHPEKSARAAAGLLRKLHGMFGSWPLALAAYNAGEGTVRRALKANGATTFAEIADKLPSETRLYVPKVLALVALRTGTEPEELAAPRAR